MKNNNDVVIIQLDRERHLKYGHTALKMLSELTGKDITEIDQGGFDPSNFELIEKMAYCGLLKDARENGEKLTLEQIPELLDESPSYSHTMEKIIAAWYVTFGAKADQSGNQQPGGTPANEADTTGTKASE